MHGALRRGLWLTAFVAAGMALAWSGWLERTGALVPRCPFHALTGLWCPGCGGTRAAMRLLHLDVLGALHFNAPAVLAAPVLAYWLVRHGTLHVVAWKRWHIAVLFALLLTFTVTRNIPRYPFTLLVGP